MSDTHPNTDLQLLAQYSRHNAEEAFAEIVRVFTGLEWRAWRPCAP